MKITETEQTPRKPKYEVLSNIPAGTAFRYNSDRSLYLKCVNSIVSLSNFYVFPINGLSQVIESITIYPDANLYPGVGERS